MRREAPACRRGCAEHSSAGVAQSTRRRWRDGWRCLGRQAAGSLLSVGCWLVPTMAQAGQPAHVQPADSGVSPARLLADFPLDDGARWFVGGELEGSVRHFERDSVEEPKLGLSTGYHLGPWNPHARLVLGPFQDVENMTFGAGAGLRTQFELWGERFSYSVGVSVEARLRNSFWVAYASPLELGYRVYQGGTFRVWIQAGVRRVMEGRLINSFLVDPNGFNNEEVQRELDVIRVDEPWQGFLSIRFGRRI